MSQRDPPDPPDSSQATDRETPSTSKRKFSNVYDPTASEQFPDIPWYNLDYQVVISQVNEMLDEIILGLKKYTANDPDIKALVEAAEKAKKLPDLEKCRMAVLGEQAAGKSTLLSALFGRALLERSGGRKSCTAMPVVLTHKDGADDNTKLSDIIIEWISKGEHLDHILEHIRRWADVYPGSQEDTNEEEDEDAHDEEETNDTAQGAEAEEVRFNLPKVREALKSQRGASTAKEFFEIIFNVEEDKAAKKFLESRLYNTDIRQGDFKDICLEKLSARFRQLSPELRIKNDVSEFFDVHDRDLGKKRKLAKKLWPFVKIFTIATGHILLRYGMCFYDLPGMIQVFLTRRSC